MAPVPVQIQPTAPDAGDDEIEFVPDLDTYVEHSMCSCNAGDDKPYYRANVGRAGSAWRPGPSPASRMTVQHTDWDDLGQPVCDLIQARTGPVLSVRAVTAGLNSHVAVVLNTAGGQVFVKGLRTDHPGVVRQHREAMINPHVLPPGPAAALASRRRRMEPARLQLHPP